MKMEYSISQTKLSWDLFNLFLNSLHIIFSAKKWLEKA